MLLAHERHVRDRHLGREPPPPYPWTRSDRQKAARLSPRYRPAALRQRAEKPADGSRPAPRYRPGRDRRIPHLSIRPAPQHHLSWLSQTAARLLRHLSERQARGAALLAARFHA